MPARPSVRFTEPATPWQTSMREVKHSSLRQPPAMQTTPPDFPEMPASETLGAGTQGLRHISMSTPFRMRLTLRLEIRRALSLHSETNGGRMKVCLWQERSGSQKMLLFNSRQMHSTCSTALCSEESIPTLIAVHSVT